MSTAITSFTGEYRFLSNFYPAEVFWLGMDFKTVEHAYQATKCFDVDYVQAIRACQTPAQAKALGSRCELRHDWDEVKVPIMSALVCRKFNGSGELRGRLLATGNATLVEGNTWGDKFWGVCDGEGRNMLGKILMETRAMLNGDIQ